MKRPILHVLILLLFLAIQSFAQEHKINISIDTTYIKLKQITKPAVSIYLNNAVKFNNKYYCIIKEVPLTESSWSENKFLIISENGDIEKEIHPLNKNIYYSKLFIYKDNIVFQKNYNPRTYYLDTTNYKWIEGEDADDLIYEDEEFYVTYMDFGEWGSTTWFRNKKTNKEYDIAGVPNVYRLNGAFYFINSNVIYTLDNVHKLKPSRENHYYKLIREKSYKEHIEGSKNLPELITYFQDTNYKPFSFNNNFRIIKSFIADNNLYHICSDSTKNYIGFVSNKKMVVVDTLPKDINISNCSFRSIAQKDNSQLLKFNKKENVNQFGFIDIKDNNIKVRYFIHDIDSVDYVGKERFEMAFDSIFNYIINNKDITISEIDSLESIYGGLDTKLIFEKKNIPDTKHNLNKGKRYYKIQDSIISNCNNYYFAENDSIIKYFYIEFSQTPRFKKNNNDTGVTYESPYIKDFDLKFNQVLEKLTLYFGKPKIEIGKYITDYIWDIKERFNIKLYRWGDGEIRIFIEKE